VRDLHRAVEREIASHDLLEDLDGALEAVVALQHLGAEILRVISIFLARLISCSRVSRGNLAHLREVHADRIVDPLGDASASSSSR
jgi:hypothetical protein